jgi:hypothetical protein
MMTPAQRKKLKDNFSDGYPIDTLINNRIVAVPRGQEKDFLLLQEAFDRGDRTEFDSLLESCEHKYVAEQVSA